MDGLIKAFILIQLDGSLEEVSRDRYTSKDDLKVAIEALSDGSGFEIIPMWTKPSEA